MFEADMDAQMRQNSWYNGDCHLRDSLKHRFCSGCGMHCIFRAQKMIACNDSSQSFRLLSLHVSANIANPMQVLSIVRLPVSQQNHLSASVTAINVFF